MGAEPAGLVAGLTEGVGVGVWVAVIAGVAVAVAAAVAGEVGEAVEGPGLPEQAAVRSTRGRTTSKVARITASNG
ncbi:MAG TPA: hypothetical protein VFD59_00450 [Nocardioidaceae bacterium]|nr:hypothetical protein [Nocardioidaceae bacterium]